MITSYLCTLKLCADLALGDGCPVTDAQWHKYVAPAHEYVLTYPGITTPEFPPEHAQGLLSRTSFHFDQPFDSDGNSGVLKFSFQVSVWSNPSHLNPEQWARKENPSRAIVASSWGVIAKRKAFSLKLTNLSWITMKDYIEHADRMYEVSYMDVYTGNDLLSPELRTCWKQVLDRMLASFAI